MRIALIYAPPWKIAEPGEPLYPPGEGPPQGNEDFPLTGDFIEAPYGLLSLAKQSKRAGHDVRVLNLSTFGWSEVQRIIARLDADLFGLCMFTANRRGTLFVAELIRENHPRAHITLGGPHAAALPREILARSLAVDSVATGEGERTFEALVHRLERGDNLEDLPGLALRGSTTLGPERIRDLDTISDFHEDWQSPFVITSRGCPGRCTYCGSNTIWGRGLRFHSVSYVLDMLERVVNEHGIKLVAIKDDTFTSDRRRARRICEGILERGLSFLWTCDTRVDALDDEVLEAMRRAGAVRLSLGIETPDPLILENIHKRQDPARMVELTRAAQSFGFIIRYYMMAGNRGETWESCQRSLAFVREARPNQYLYSALAVYPGTEEWTRLKRDHGVPTDIFFDEDFLKPMVFPDTPPEDATRIVSWLKENPGIHDLYRYTTDELERVAQRFPETPSVWMDLAAACLEAAQLEEARSHVARARALGHPLPGLGDNLLAGAALAEGHVEQARTLLARAARGYPHQHIMENARRFDAWEAAGRPGSPPALAIHPDYGLAAEPEQPVKPGPIDLESLPFSSMRAPGAASRSTG